MAVNERFNPQAQLMEVPDSPQIHEINVPDYLNNLPENQFLMYSPSALRSVEVDSRRYRSRGISVADTSISLSALQRVAIPDACDEISVFGAGKAIDMSKYLAYAQGKKLNIVPSLLSTNALGTPFGCYENSADDPTKTTIETGYADKIFVDYSHLQKQGKANLYGLADAMSIATALHDWDLAIKQDPSVDDSAIYEKASNIRDACFETVQSDKLDIRSIFNLIVNSAYVTGLHGSGRPESGSEHIFSKYLELKTMREGGVVMHGQSVGLGILLMATLQRNAREQEVFGAVRKLGFLTDYVHSKDELKEKATEVLTHIQPHAIRYSVVDSQLDNLRNQTFSSDLSSEVVERLFEDEVEVL